MRYNPLGRTGIFVSEICLGTMTFGSAGEAGQWGKIAASNRRAPTRSCPLARRRRQLHRHRRRLFLRPLRALLGQSLKNLGVSRKDVVIATKFLGAMGEGPNERGASRGHIMDSVEASLKRLQTDHIDLYQIHGTDPVTPLEETLRALDDLVRAARCATSACPTGRPGDIAKALGISEQARLCALRDAPVLLFDRRPRPRARDRAAAQGREARPDGVEPAGRRSAVRQIWPARARQRRRRAPRRFRFPAGRRGPRLGVSTSCATIAAKHWCRVAQVALAWLLAQPLRDDRDHRREDAWSSSTHNLAATDAELDADEIAALDEVSALKPEYPGWMVERQGRPGAGAVCSEALRAKSGRWIKPARRILPNQSWRIRWECNDHGRFRRTTLWKSRN